MSAELRAEAAHLLQRLIACDTSNPPGRESQAAALLAHHLEAAGVRCELVARDPERANLVARLPGGSGPTLAFITHLDVVPAPHHGWEIEPFAGIERDGAIWGRGAVDMKCQVAAAATALASLAREGVRPPGDVLLLAVADEERGDAGVGMPWLVEERPDIGTDFAVGEGAGERFDTPNGPLYLLERCVKQGAKVRLRVIGAGGDGSLPGAGDDPLPELARLLVRLPQRLGPERVGDEVTGILDAAGAEGATAEERLEALRRGAPQLSRVVDAITVTTVRATEADAAVAPNVVADEAFAMLQCALLPGDTVDDLLRQLREALGPGSYELEVDAEPHGGTAVPVETPLRDVIASFLEEHDPDARLVPTLGYGYSDSDVLRERFGTVAYGFIPFRHADPAANLDSKHGANERVLLDDLLFQVLCARYVASRLQG